MAKEKNSWQKHLDSYRKEHPEKKLSECMKEAKKTYSKDKK